MKFFYILAKIQTESVAAFILFYNTVFNLFI